MGPVIGLDIGTSAVKAVLIDDAQRLLAEASVPLATTRPRPGWSEQAPDEWWQATQSSLAILRSAAPGAYAATAAIGLSGQMHGLVALDRRHHPVRPAILWNDGRATAECDALMAAVPDLGQIAGVIAMPGFAAPKLLWLQRHEPAAYAAIAHVVLPKDYVRLQLTGATVTDMADAAGTLWLDEARRDWSPALLAASGVDPAWLPNLVEGPAIAGQLRPAIAAELGLPAAVPVAGGAGDAAAGGIGIGFVVPGDAYLSLGTSAQLFLVTDRYRPAPETLVHAFAHGLPGRWFQMGAMLNGASPLAHIAGLIGRGDIGAVLAEVEQQRPAPGTLLYLPYLAGERTPHNNADARGVLFGLDGAATPHDVVRAVLEGVAFTIADAKAALSAAGTQIGAIGAVGGGTRSAFWMQLMADVLGVPVKRFGGADTGPAFGAARLGLMAATGVAPEAVATKPPCTDTFVPRPELTAIYARTLTRFRALYRALLPEFIRARG